MATLFGSSSVVASRSAVRVAKTQRAELLHLLQRQASDASLDFSSDSYKNVQLSLNDRENVQFSRQFVGALQEASEEAERVARVYSEQELRLQRRASERERLTNALHSTLQKVSPQRYLMSQSAVNSVPAVSSALEEVAIRTSMKRLFGEEEPDKQTYKNRDSFINRITARLFGSRRKTFIGQLKEVHDARANTRDSFN